MKMTDKLGLGSSVIATITLGHINTWLGVITFLFTVFCLLPRAIREWRQLLYDYREFVEDLGVTSNLRVFVWFLFVRGKARAKKAGPNES